MLQLLSTWKSVSTCHWSLNVMTFWHTLLSTKALSLAIFLYQIPIATLGTGMEMRCEYSEALNYSWTILHLSHWSNLGSCWLMATTLQWFIVWYQDFSTMQQITPNQLSSILIITWLKNFISSKDMTKMYKDAVKWQLSWATSSTCLYYVVM